MDHLRNIEVFVRTVELGTFTAAAAELGMSSTMVGKHIRHLEDRVGSVLLNRTTRRQCLTEVGKVYFDRCLNVLAEVASADTSAHELLSTPRGRLRIGAPVHFGASRLIPALAQFAGCYPEVAIDLVLNDQPLDLIEDRLEACFCIGEIPADNLVARELSPLRIVMCASPGYIQKWGTPAAPEDLPTHKCLAYKTDSSSAEWTLVGPGGLHRVAFRTGFQVNDCEGLRMAAIEGMGIAQLAETLIATDLSQRRLIKVLPQYTAVPRPLRLVYLPQRRFTPKLRAFVDFAVARFGAAGHASGADTRPASMQSRPSNLVKFPQPAG
jgi:DNA-binding transcriptional LysR family regulator